MCLINEVQSYSSFASENNLVPLTNIAAFSFVYTAKLKIYVYQILGSRHNQCGKRKGKGEERVLKIKPLG